MLYALIDCNNFFVSCERVGHPELAARPVIVLSNNDGCAVAISNEAKALGVKRGAPLFKIRDIVEAHGVIVLSGRHRHYSACSRRVMAALASLNCGLEVYSIDEAFLTLPDDLGDLSGFGRYIVKRVWDDAEIPVSVGIAQTKTLAKAATYFAKKYPAYEGVCVMSTEQQRLKALSLLPIRAVWGIGRRLSRAMMARGILTALDFVNLDRHRVRLLTNVVGERTWLELSGQPCIGHVSAEEPNKSILSSRSFEHELYHIEPLRQAISTFIAQVGRKLRAQHSLALDLQVFIATNRFSSGHQYCPSASMVLEEPTDFTPALLQAACTLLTKIFKRGYGYKRAGVCVHHVCPASSRQPGLFDDPLAGDKRKRLMQVTDRLNNAVPGRDCVRIASMGDGLGPMVASGFRHKP